MSLRCSILALWRQTNDTLPRPPHPCSVRSGQLEDPTPELQRLREKLDLQRMAALPWLMELAAQVLHHPPTPALACGRTCKMSDCPRLLPLSTAMKSHPVHLAEVLERSGTHPLRACKC